MCAAGCTIRVWTSRPSSIRWWRLPAAFRWFAAGLPVTGDRRQGRGPAARPARAPDRRLPLRPHSDRVQNPEFKPLASGLMARSPPDRQTARSPASGPTRCALTMADPADPDCAGLPVGCRRVDAARRRPRLRRGPARRRPARADGGDRARGEILEIADVLSWSDRWRTRATAPTRRSTGCRSSTGSGSWAVSCAPRWTARPTRRPGSPATRPLALPLVDLARAAVRMAFDGASA